MKEHPTQAKTPAKSWTASNITYMDQRAIRKCNNSKHYEEQDNNTHLNQGGHHA